MRWARDRDLPVRRMPGGKQGTVFAYRVELDAWAHRPDAAAGEGPAPAPARPAAAEAAHGSDPGTGRRRGAAAGPLLTATLVLAAGAAALLWPVPAPRPRTVLPRDPATARAFVEARDLWARRTGADLDRAVALLDGVTRREPGFAPAHAALADAWLLKREYGITAGAAPFDRAERAARAALRLDPDAAGAIRALGFIAYWRDGDPARARAGFEHALRLAPDDAQTHFWYANFLADTGADARAQQAYDRAQLLAPGLAAVRVERAYADWLAGRDARARDALAALARQYPSDANLHLCLAWIAMGRGDAMAYARETALVARLRRDPELLARAAAVSGVASGGPAAVARAVVEQQRLELAANPDWGRQTPAFFASSLGQRDALLRLLREAEAHGERWYSAGILRRMAARWRGDAAVTALLTAVRRRSVPGA